LVVTGDYYEAVVKAVGVKQLKARLSEYLRLVKSGETILVTERDEVVAELRPSRRQAESATSLDEILERLADAGEITRPSLSKEGWVFRSRGAGLEAGIALRLLDELSSDR
jgi:antitoxin (DNA-binding transcriptional repressor) of toxin-antitoxin stability system